MAVTSSPGFLGRVRNVTGRLVPGRLGTSWPRTVPAAVLGGAELIHLGGGESLPCPDAERLPLDPSVRALGLGTSALALPPARVHRLTDVVVCPGSGVVLSRDGRVVAESVTPDMVGRAPLVPSEFRTPVRRLPGTVALYRSPWRSRYHTLIDHLPRAALLAHPAMRRTGAVTLLHDGPLGPVESWLLPELVGRNVRLMEVEPGTPVVADAVLVPGYVTRAGAGAIPSWYRRWADGVADRAASGGPRRFFIDSGAGSTGVANRQALDDVLARHQVVSVDPTTMDPAAAVGMFRDAELVVGVHGTGVSQVLFCRGAHVVELMQGRTLLPRLYYLATSKGLPYDYVPSVDRESARRHPAHPGGDGVVVDVTWLDSLLGRLD
jgi:hypothetical protein